VIDNSGSLRLQLDTIIDIGKFITSNLREQDKAFMVRFVSSDKISLLQDWTTDKTLLNKSLDSMFIEGGTSSVVDGLYTSFEYLEKRTKENSSRRYALVLISDCEDRDSYYNLSQFLDKKKGTDIQIFVVALTSGLANEKRSNPNYSSPREKAENFANKLALKTGGNVYFPTGKENNKKPYSETLKPLIDELQSNYVIGYISTNENRANRPRKLRVEISDSAKRQAFIRESFVVPKD
jgi:VWFA-related protein